MNDRWHHRPNFKTIKRLEFRVTRAGGSLTSEGQLRVNTKIDSVAVGIMKI